jgi:hypothetical protein
MLDGAPVRGRSHSSALALWVYEVFDFLDPWY